MSFKFSLFHYLSALLIAILYLLLTVLIPNWRLFFYALHYFKLQETALFIWYSLGATWSSRTTFDFVLTIISAILVGTNAMLIISTIRSLGQTKKITLSVGGASILSIIATGCASCGLSLISVFGLTGVVSLLPFHGLEVHLISITILTLSLWYMLNQLQKAKECPANQDKSRRK